MGNRKELWDICRAPTEIILQVGSYHRRWWAAKIKFQWGSSVLGHNVNVYGGLRCRSDCLGTLFEWVICGSLTLLDVSALTLLSVFTPFIMFLRFLPVSREKGLWVARALRMITVSFIFLVCLALYISLFCSPGVNWTPVGNIVLLCELGSGD